MSLCAAATDVVIRLFCFCPLTGDTPEAAAALLQGQLAALCDGGVTVSELSRVQRATRAGLLASAQSNSAMASALASYHVLTGRAVHPLVHVQT